MKNIRKEAAVWLHISAFAAIWIALLFLEGGELKLDLAAVKKLPEVVTLYSILVYLFNRWIWKWRVLQGWLVPLPNLTGTWAGSLKSSWVDPKTGQGVPPIPVILAIRQTFDSINCVLYTAESESYSVAASINRDDDSDILRLDYSYTNRPKLSLRDRSAIHDGAASLRIITSPKRQMEGEYWTSRMTTGEMSFVFKDKAVAQVFVPSSAMLLLSN